LTQAADAYLANFGFEYVLVLEVGMVQSRKPKVFIASSKEGLRIAHAIHSVLDHDTSPTTWPNGTFSLSNHTIEDLVTKSSDVDFAIFVFHPDDVLESRGESMTVVRDNVIFELGLFIGAIGRHRCYIIKPRSVELHLPSDLLGINPADYDPARIEDDADSAVIQACTKIRSEIKKHGLLDLTAPSANGQTKSYRPNPPQFKLNDADFEFLGIAAASQVSAANGLSSWHFSNALKSWSDQSLNLAALKLLRLGYIEKTIAPDREGDLVYSMFITDEGVDALLNREAQSPRETAPPAPVTIKNPAARTISKAKPDFSSLDDDIPY
jgi:hypothetical protein